MIILRAINEDGVKYDLDVLENADLKLDISAIESGDIGDVFGISSQAYALPGNENNNKFFGLLFDLGTTPATAFTKSVPCQVLYNGAEVFTGKLFIDNVVTNQKGDTIYNVTVVNEVVDFKYLIDDLTMQDLDWDYFNHTLNMANITGSWDNNLFGGDVIYPLVDYGVDPEDPKSPALKAGGKAKNFDNSSTPLRDIDFRPAVRLKTVIDMIFDKVNYKYESTFFDSSYFDNLYVLATQTESGNQFSSPVTASVWSQKGSTQTLTNNTPQYLDFTTEIYDNSNAWNTNTYTVPQDGDYTFYSQLTFGNITGTRPTSAEYLDLEWHVNGGQVAASKINILGTNGATVYSGPFTLSGLTAGDDVKLYAYISTNPVYSASYPLTLGKITIDGPPTYQGGTVHLGQIFENNLPVLEFLKGVINKFNLVMEPVVGQRNLITVEPFNDWNNQGSVVDWTDKVDRSVRWEITHPVQDQPRNIKLSDVEDTDQLNRYTQDRYNKIYGEYNYVSDSDLATGEKSIGSFFAPTPIKGIDGSPQMLVPRLCQFTPGDVYSSPYNFKPRLLYNVGKVKAGVQLNGFDNGSSTYDYGKYWVRDDSGVAVKKDEYLLVHHLNLDVSVGGYLQDADFNSTRDLHFGNNINPGVWSYHQNQYNAKVKQSAFYQYWAFYLNELYDVDARKVTLNVLLKPAEIQSLKLNSKIFIDGHYYRIDNISGANLTREDSVEVTLLKVLQRKLYFPRRRVIDIGIGIGNDLTVDDASYSVAGTVGYVDYDTGQVVSGSLVQAVANKDGFTTYDNGNTVVWDTTPSVTYTQTSQNNFGNNYIEESATRVSATGDNNEIKASAKEVNVVGDNNVVAEYVETAQVTGRSNQLKVGTENVAIVNSNSNVISGSTDSVILGGGSNTIINSSLTAIVNSPGSDILNSESSRDVILGGLNVTVDDSQTTVVINGNGETLTDMNGNTVIGNFQDVTNITGSDYRFGTTLMAGTYIEEDYYINRHPHNIVLAAGETEYAYSGTGLYKRLYNLSWDITSGSGTATIELPGIVNQDQFGRSIIFKGDASLSPSSSFTITSVAGTDTFDGAASYVLDSPYDTIEFVATRYQTDRGFSQEWRAIGGGGIGGGGATGYGYGNFYSTGSQPLTTAGIAQAVQLDSTYEASGIHIASGSRIYFDNAGTYQFNYIAQVANTDNAVHDAVFWIEYNGVVYPNSNTYMSLQPRKNSGEPNYQLMACTFTGTAQNDNDYIELYWTGDSTTLSLFYTGSNQIDGEPATPSVIANVMPVGVMGAGSTTVSASYATSASYSDYAVTASYALNGGGGGAAFPYTGSAEITGSLAINNIPVQYTPPTATYLRPIVQTFVVPTGATPTDYHISGSGRYRFDMSNYAGLTNAGKINMYLHIDDIEPYTDVQIEWKMPPPTAFDVRATGQTIITCAAGTEYYLSNVWSGLPSWSVVNYTTSTRTFLQHSGFEPQCMMSVVKNGEGEIYISNIQNPEEGPTYVLYSGSLGTPLT